MSFEFLNQLPTPADIKRDYPLSPELRELKKHRDLMISDVITGKDSRVLVIIGPCSADNEDSVCDYVSRLTKIQEDVKDQVILVPRIYTNKPRTTGEGYKGIASQPDPEKAPDMIEGLIAMRKMHIRAIEESGLTCADEMLYPENWGYVEDLLSYVAIGARSVEDQQHRLTASGVGIPVGCRFRNEKSYQWRFFCYAQFCIRGTASASFRLSRIRGGDNRKSSDSRGSSRCSQQARQYHPELSL